MAKIGAPSSLRTQVIDGASDAVTIVAPLEGNPEELRDRACADGWEGLIAKRVDAPYRSGRSSDWRKLKCSASQELVIGGWTDPSGARTGFGALLLGHYGDDGLLHYAGKVGTGFDQQLLRELHRQLLSREVEQSPFAETVRLKGVHWGRPDLVAEVGFSEWTADGRLRHPSFHGLCVDKDPTSVRREKHGPPGAGG